MSDSQTTADTTLTAELAARGYWPAQAAERLADGRYADTISLCREHLNDHPDLLSGLNLYGKALYHSGQTDKAAEEFRKALTLDPDNLVALKYLGDTAFDSGDIAAAFSFYHRVLEIDPHCRGLKSEIKLKSKEITRTITLARGSEVTTSAPVRTEREIPFYTETVGDLYLAQGHSRLASDVFRHLYARDRSERIADKLAEAEGRSKEKEN